MQGSQTMGKTKKTKTSQRHSAGNIDYDNVHCSQDVEEVPIHTYSTFRTRSKTVGDTVGELTHHFSNIVFLLNL